LARTEGRAATCHPRAVWLALITDGAAAAGGLRVPGAGLEPRRRSARAVARSLGQVVRDPRPFRLRLPVRGPRGRARLARLRVAGAHAPPQRAQRGARAGRLLGAVAPA